LDWIQEKTYCKAVPYPSISISIEDLESESSVNLISEKLLSINQFTRVVLNATTYDHLKVFALALEKVNEKGRQFIFRTAASLPKVLGGVEDRNFLNPDEILDSSPEGIGSLTIVGSHVNLTTQQVTELKELDYLSFYEFNQHLVLDKEQFNKEIEQAIRTINELLAQGKDVVFYTKRERLDLGQGDESKELELSLNISDGICKVVSNIQVRPKFIIAKGGITSSEIATQSLGIKKAHVLGQVLSGVSVWETGDESKFPRLPYIVFPGNVGEKDSLKKLHLLLSNREQI
jgi:uncharacterized protein YgbK (DUF1537 family)